ncbi:hypothetical protein Vadar_032461 [Vaccinium darrowii]|uniref:Uncharacterized protein n=1 Tax=Vaccinium darrowii TaxID=229202 RepID=A0ACB7YAI5_9ERIC|nr:hypothetical protein Vadar_032461 [Vaccinium darrowii]
MIPLFWLELNMGPEFLGTGLPRGVKAVVAKSFESTHRSNLVGMGIIPLCFKDGEDAETLGLTGHERYISVSADNGKPFTCALRCDTVVELAYFNHGGILHYVIRNLLVDAKR